MCNVLWVCRVAASACLHIPPALTRETETHTHTQKGLIQRHRQTFRPLIKLQRHTDLPQRTVSLLRRCSLSSLLCWYIKCASEMSVDLQYRKSTEQQYRMNLESLRHSWDLLKCQRETSEMQETGFALHWEFWSMVVGF